MDEIELPTHPCTQPIPDKSVKKVPDMHWKTRLLLLLSLLALSVFTVAHATLFQSNATASMANSTVINNPIKHIVFIEKENHTFDSMFGGYECLDSQGNRTVSCVNGASTGQVKVKGKVVTIPLNRTPDQPANFCHEWACAHKAADNGKMDNFNATIGCTTRPYPCHDEGMVGLAPNYWSYADHYVLGR